MNVGSMDNISTDTGVLNSLVITSDNPSFIQLVGRHAVRICLKQGNAPLWPRTLADA